MITDLLFFWVIPFVATIGLLGWVQIQKAAPTDKSLGRRSAKLTGQVEVSVWQKFYCTLINQLR